MRATPRGARPGAPGANAAEPRPAPFDERSLAAAVRALTRADGVLAGIVRRHGPPPLWPRRPGFRTLARMILEQQLERAVRIVTKHRASVDEVVSGLLERDTLEHDEILACFEQPQM